MCQGWEIIYKYNHNQGNKIKKIACILGYYQGSEYIKDQIQSIFNQELNNCHLTIFISDDNSNEIFPNLNDLNNEFKVDVYYRKLKKNVGYAKNFIFSLRDIKLKFDYFCFSDQDDIWFKNKLKKGLNKLNMYENNSPNLYCSRTFYYDQKCLKRIGESSLFSKPPSFKNAIIQNIAGGNTMIFNSTAKALIINSLFNDIKIVSHDWWIYQLISGAGGNIFYDKNAYIKYRQHNSNIIGSNTNIKGIFIRIIKLTKGNLKLWNDINIYGLEKNKSILTKENKFLLERFSKLRKANFFNRLFNSYKLNIYRQKRIGTLAIYLSFILKKI